MPVLWRRDPGSSQEVQALRGMDGRQTTVSQIKWNGETAAQRLAELEHYFIQHCKDNQADIRELREAMDLLIDRTKPAKIGFKTD